jgi:hypothetical protein
LEARIVCRDPIDPVVAGIGLEMTWLAGACRVREPVQEGVIERAEAHTRRAGEIESAGAQVDLVTVALQMQTSGPIPVTRRPILPELGPQVPAR